jgi:hypothetical protein
MNRQALCYIHLVTMETLLTTRILTRGRTTCTNLEIRFFFRLIIHLVHFPILGL